MDKTTINPDALVSPRGFSHGIAVTGGRLLFLAGQTGSNTKGEIATPGNLVAQYEQVLLNLQIVVEAAGGKMQDIVQLTIYVRNRDDYQAHLKELGPIHRAFFGRYYPTMALIEISRLFQDDALIEIEGMAVIGSDASSSIPTITG